MNNSMLTTSASFQDNLVSQMSTLKKFAWKFTTELEEVNDLVQETLLKAMSSFDKYQMGSNLRAWLYVLMKNIYINEYRKLNQQRKFYDTATITQLYFSTSTNHSNGGDEKLVNTDVSKAMEKLKPIFNQSFKLFVSGYKYEEIANRLQLPIGTVKTRIFVARTQLKTLLADYQFKS